MARTLTLTLGRQVVSLPLSGVEVTAELGAAAAAAQLLTIQAQPTGGTDNTAFSTQPSILATNGFGVPVAGVTVTASIESGSGSLIGSTTAVTNGSGIATFTTLGINDNAF